MEGAIDHMIVCIAVQSPLIGGVSICLQGIRSGSTAVVTLTRGKQLYVGWVGDSQAWLVRRGKPVQLMEPHKPDREVSGHWDTCSCGVGREIRSFRVDSICVENNAVLLW